MRECLPPDPQPVALAEPLPTYTCDTHCHIIGPRSQYDFVPERSYTPPDSPLAAYVGLREALGVERSVIVQPGAHGTDNRVTRDAVRTLGPDAARGVVVVAPDISTAELEAMHEDGIRGVRLSTLLRGAAVMEDLTTVAEKIAPLGWHILFHLKNSAELADLAPHIRNLPVPVVLDHMARVTGSEGPASPGFGALLSLLRDTDHCWTKICSWYRLSADQGRHDDMKILAEEVMSTRLDRILWGTNWPHPLMFEPPMPNDGVLVNQFLGWAETDVRRKAILVDNPANLYGF